MEAQLRARTSAPTEPSAQALPVPAISVHDRTGDATFPYVDVTGAGIAQNGSGTSFALTVKAPRNPKTDASWRAGNVTVFWAVDTNGDDQIDAAALMTADASGNLVGLVGGLEPNTSCAPTGVFLPGVGYRFSALAGCLPHLTTARFNVCMIFGDLSNDQTPADCAPDNSLYSSPVVVQQSLNEGYWMLGSDGAVYPFGGALGFPGLAPGAVAMAPRANGKGYWVVDVDGHVFAHGNAGYFGGAPALGAGELVSSISATPSGGGYWLFTNRGRVFPFGNAKAYGDMSATVLAGPIIASVATPSGHGYYLVGSDGGIFSFGDAHFHGSMGGVALNKPIVGISPTPSGHGYWLVASDGGVFAFNAPFRGSMGGAALNQPVDGLVAYGNGYLMVASDGGIFDFSNKAFLGSLPPNPPTAPIIGLAAYSAT